MASTQLPCIWCLKVRPKAKEHIVPEVLGCPSGFVLNRGEVCSDCNTNRLSRLDAVLGESFDFLRVQARIPDKKGKPPKITGRTNLRAFVTRKGQVTLHLNLEPHPVDAGSLGAIPPTSGSHRDITGSIERTKNFAHGRMIFTIGDDPDFSRAIHKVAFEYVVKITSWTLGVDRKFDPVRRYVIDGEGHREVLTVVPQDWRYYHEFPKRVWNDENGFVCVDFILCGLPFAVALGSDQQIMEKLKQEMQRLYGPTGSASLPVTVKATP